VSRRKRQSDSNALASSPQASEGPDRDVLDVETPERSDPSEKPPVASANEPGPDEKQAQASTPPSVRSEQNAAGQVPKKGGKSKRVFALVLLAGLGFGGYEAYHWWTVGRFFESTDDAYVKSDITVILSKVSGYVSSVEVRDNQHVKAGDVLIRIDDGDYRLAVQSAKNSISSAEATVDRIATQIEAAKTSVRQAEATVASAEAAYDEAQANYTRQKKLADNKFASQATLDTAEAGLKQARADLKRTKVSVELAKADVEVLIGQKKEAGQAVSAAKTAHEQAERDLQFTVLRAPVDGIVGNRAAQVGSLLQPGSRIAAIVPLADTHIDANFKETQLEGIHPGAEVEISVDAYPDQPIKGTVESISPATGSVFSLLPSENATGNFTKVVQRVPVKIKVPEEEIASGHLRAGMSVIVEVDTRTGGEGENLTQAAMR